MDDGLFFGRKNHVHLVLQPCKNVFPVSATVILSEFLFFFEGWGCLRASTTVDERSALLQDLRNM